MDLIIGQDPIFNRKASTKESFEDMADDSTYPLWTKDPNKKREYTLKVNGITTDKLDKVFDNTNKE